MAHTGAPEGIRTPDLRLRRPLLYPTELLAPKTTASNKRRVPPGLNTHYSLTQQSKWSGREDLNFRPPAPKAGALPGCATPRQRPEPFYTAKVRNQGFAALARNCGKIRITFSSALPRWLTFAFVSRSSSPKVFPNGG